MAERFDKLDDKHMEFIRQQHMYFVGTAGAEGYVNVSPKGMDSLRILILRLYGQATAIHPRDERWGEFSALYRAYTGARQIFLLELQLVQTSCGYAVPYYELKGERPTLTKWAENRGVSGIKDYWLEKNRRSLNDMDTGIQP